MKFKTALKIIYGLEKKGRIKTKYVFYELNNTSGLGIYSDKLMFYLEPC